MPNLQFKYETGMPNDDLYQSTSEALLFGHKFEFAASKNEKQVLQVINKENTTAENFHLHEQL